jgi:hypothetical protein
MRNLRVVTLLVLSATLVLACGSGGGPTDETSTEPTSEASNDGGGGDGQGGDGVDNGTLRFEISGALSKSGELGFTSPISLFDSAGDGSGYLIFTDGDAAIYVTLAADESFVIYGDGVIGVTPLGVGGVGSCTTDIDELDSDSAKGTFECTDMTAYDGEAVTGKVTMTGNFEAHK